MKPPVFMLLTLLLAGFPDAAFAAQPLARSTPQYSVVTHWPALPAGTSLGQVSGVGVDSHDNVFVFTRAQQGWAEAMKRRDHAITNATVLLFDGKIGRQLAAWGENFFHLPHGLTVDHEDNIWLTDVVRQQVFKFTHDGKLLLTLGERDKAGDDGGHFNQPTDVAVASDGSFYVSDGYQNSRVAKFAADGKFLFAWGTKGDGPGQLRVPHGIALDARGRVLVADRGNARVQVFEPDGKFVTEWKSTEIGRPWSLAVARDHSIFVVDGGDQTKNSPDRARIVRLDASGNVMENFGSFGHRPGEFIWPHDVAVARDGSVYVVEVSVGMRVQKFVRGVNR